MFGFGPSKQEKFIEYSIPTVFRALFSQFSSIGSNFKFDKSELNENELFMYAAWVYHLAIMNSGVSISLTRKLQNVLNNNLNQYYFEYASTNFPDRSPEEQRYYMESLFNVMSDRAIEYNDAFNQDKIASYDPETPDYLVGEITNTKLINHYFGNPHNCHEIFISGLVQNATGEIINKVMGTGLGSRNYSPPD